MEERIKRRTGQHTGSPIRVYNRDLFASRDSSKDCIAGGISRFMSRCLIFDADDTLWENNIFFERAIEEFLDLMAPLAPEPQHVLDLLRQVEQEFIPRWGYGSRNFINALRETYRRHCGPGNGVGFLRAIDEIGERLLNHPIEILPGVPSTLETLRRRYRLMLFTKGDSQEQSAKVSRSGLKRHFDRIEVVEEKNTEAYHALALRHSLHKPSTFMVGNSPRSDVLPALEAGLWAIYIPHPHTWDLEHQEVKPHPRLLVAQSVQELPSLLAEVLSEPD